MPGDIILVQTPTKIYEGLRKLANSSYDHMVVVLDDSKALHVSYPTAKATPAALFMLSKRAPLLIRPSLTSAQRKSFIDRLSLLEGAKYDYMRTFNMLANRKVDYKE